MAVGGHSFFEAMRDRAGIVSLELRPSTSINDGHLEGFDALDDAAKQEFTDKVFASFIESPAGDLLRLSGHVMFDWSSG